MAKGGNCSANVGTFGERLLLRLQCTCGVPLAKAAADHCKYLGTRGTVALKGDDGLTAVDRLHRYSQTRGEANATSLFGQFGTSGYEVIQELMINDGIISRKHRKRMLNPKFNLTGISHCQHTKHEKMAVIVYA